jgi:hypothetical protein
LYVSILGISDALQPVGPLDFVELLKRLPVRSRMPTYIKGLQGGRQDIFDQPVSIVF